MPFVLIDIFSLIYADADADLDAADAEDAVDADTVTPSSNTRSFTCHNVPSSLGR